MGKSKQQARIFQKDSLYYSIKKKISKSNSNGNAIINQSSQDEQKKIDLKYGEIITLKNNKNQQYQILNKISEGGQAIVFECQNQSQHQNQNLAIKVFKSNQDKRYLETQGLIPEGENIIKYYEFDSFEKNTISYQVVVMEKCEMNLQQYLLEKGKEQGKDSDQQGQLKKSEALKILKQILNGYMFLVNFGIVHRDLKPSNILLKNKVWKIGDFGLAINETEHKMKTNVGTEGYKSRQINLNLNYTSKCDVYSLGILFYEMLYGKLHNQDQRVNFRKKKLGVELKQFIKQCLEKEEGEIYYNGQSHDYLGKINEFKTNVKQLEMIEELNKLQKDVSSSISDETKQEIMKNQINLAQFLDGFKEINQFSKMKLIIAFCLLKIPKSNQNGQSVKEQISQAQMAQNEHLACLLTFYKSQIHQSKQPTVFFNGRDISEEKYVEILLKLDESLSKEYAQGSFNLLKTNETILHQDFLELFNFKFLK